MIDCPACQRAFPAIEGAALQTCPHCGHEIATFPRAETPQERVDPVAGAAAGFRAFARRYPSLLVLWLPVLVADVALSSASQAYGDTLGPGLVAGDLGTQLRYLGLALPLWLVFMVVQIATCVLVAAHVVDHVEGEGGTRALRRAFSMPGAILGLAAVLTLAAVGGMVLLLVGAIVFFHWFMFAPAALVDRGAGVSDALQASRRFAKERRTFGFTALVLFILVGLWVAWFIASTLVMMGLAGAGVTWWGAKILVSALLWWLVTPLLPALPAAYWALAQRRDATPAPDAAPGSLPAERFRTTKCPQCGTLVPYEATGGPVDVTCPSCGRHGKVL